MKVGLYFGSFNPIHHGHLLLATHIKEAAQLDEIWFIVSPQNPFKTNSELIDEHHRLKMVELAIQPIKYLKVNNIEFELPKPSYTHQTLKVLKNQFKEYEFKLIIGEDNLEKFNEWKEVEWIKQHIEILVYNRNGQNNKTIEKDFKFYQLPLFDISSTAIRNRIKNRLNINYFVPEIVNQYIIKHNLYNI